VLIKSLFSIKKITKQYKSLKTMTGNTKQCPYSTKDLEILFKIFSHSPFTDRYPSYSNVENITLGALLLNLF